jgi:hypothetical protein
MRRLLAIPALIAAVAVGAAAAAGAGAGRVSVAVRNGGGRVSLGSGVTIRLPAGWHLTHGTGTPVSDPIPRLSAATFRVRFSKQYCVCDTQHVVNFPRNGAFLFVWEYTHPSRGELRGMPAHTTHFHIGPSAMGHDSCAPSDGRAFREGGRGYEVEIYLGPSAPASARAQIAEMLDSWRVT